MVVDSRRVISTKFDMKNSFLLLVFLGAIRLGGQSIELMPGTERVFADVQWLKPFDDEFRWSIFSRSRVTVDYNENTDLFTGAYLNYTTTSGFGGTVLGKVSSNGAGGDAGVHFFKARRLLLVYALVSVGLESDPSWSWFSIVRYRPELSKNWKLYTSLELFTALGSEGHRGSVQRLRLGLDRKTWQFGLALNLSGRGRDYEQTDANPGVFIRKQFP